jgi:hypothetical protein
MMIVEEDNFPGHVVVTCDAHTGDAVAVTRQDDEGKILSVIWMRPERPRRTATPTEMTDDTSEWATKHHPLD